MGMVSEYCIRPATRPDTSVLAYHRVAMFLDMGAIAPGDAGSLERATAEYIERAMADGTFHAWVSEHDRLVVAGGGLHLRTLMPRPGYVQQEPEGLIVSMWTEPDHRRRGLGARILEMILAWSAEHGIRRLTLHASDAGRPLYAKYGFHGTNEMRLERAPV
jgi:GNAT superfamily N-acetyltransferase